MLDFHVSQVHSNKEEQVYEPLSSIDVANEAIPILVHLGFFQMFVIWLSSSIVVALFIQCITRVMDQGV